MQTQQIVYSDTDTNADIRCLSEHRHKYLYLFVHSNRQRFKHRLTVTQSLTYKHKSYGRL